MKPNFYRRARLLSILTTSLLVTPALRAQSTDKAAAEALFDQARSLETSGDYAAACAKFEASQSLDPGVGTLLYLADCYEKSGRLASAWATFHEAGRLATARAEAERARIASVRAQALQPQLLQLQIEATPPLPAGFELSRNGVQVPAAALGTPIPVDAGTWTIRATAPDHQSFETTVTLQQSGPKTPYVLRIPALTRAVPSPAETKSAAPAVVLPAPPIPKHEPPPAARDEPSTDADAQRTVAWIVGGLGALALASSGIFAVVANETNESSLDHCRRDQPNRCDASGVSLRDKALTHATLATVSATIGVIGLGAGATLYFTAPSPASHGESASGSGLGTTFVGVRGRW